MTKTLDDLVRDALEVVAEISSADAARLLATPDQDGWHFVDVREADEFSAGHIPGARHFPRGFLEVRADLDHPKRDPWWSDRSRPIICYCDTCKAEFESGNALFLCPKCETVSHEVRSGRELELINMEIS